MTAPEHLAAATELADVGMPPTEEEALAQVLDLYTEAHPGASTAVIESAFRFAREAHADQTRLTGEPFVLHPLTVAAMLARYGLDESTIVAAILHDSVEDTEIRLEQIEETFGHEVASLIDGVTKLDRISFQKQEEHQAATIRKMVIAMAKDVRVLLIKLADRLHNLRTIEPFKQEKQERIARETLEIYAPLAHRLGVQEIKHEMEDRCFKVLHPRRYAEIDELLARRAPAREGVIEAATQEVAAALGSSGIKAEVSGRPKHRYSIYRKMVDTGHPFEQIHDLIGIRVLTEDVKDCYAALGVIHTLWPPVHGRFKDYIATPKFNLYQSLHTTVVGPGGKPLEVQIRSHEMHARAEFGIAAHWGYKEGESPEDLSWMADIRFLQETYTDPEEFLAGLKIDLYRDEVFAVTPKGAVITLPAGATPVDFAYAIHTEVGHRCVGAKVNGRLVPLSTKLQSGDIVEITTSKASDAGPSQDWLQFAHTSRAAAKIRQWFNRERRAEALTAGKDQFSKALAREGLGLTDAERESRLIEVAEKLSYPDTATMFVAIGEGNLSPTTVSGRLARMAREDEDEAAEGDLLLPPRPRTRFPTPAIIVEGQSDVMVRIARCCAPVPGDDIVGFVTVGRGVSVHRSDCTNVLALEARQERMIDVAWSADRVGTFAVWVQVEALDRPKLLRDVTSTLSDMGANIYASSTATGKDRVAILRYEVELSDPRQLDRVLAELGAIEGVFDAFRLVPQVD